MVSGKGAFVNEKLVALRKKFHPSSLLPHLPDLWYSTLTMSQHLAGKRLALGAFANWMAFATNLLVAFFLAPFLIRKLGDVQYGLWIFVESLLAYLTLFDLGLAASIVRYVARYEAKQETLARNKLINTALAFYGGLGGLALLVGAVVIPLFTLRVSHQEQLPESEMITFAILMALNLAMTLPLSVFPSVLDGLGHFGRKSIVRIVSLILKTVAIIVLMNTQPSLLALGVILFAANIFEHMVLGVLCFRLLPSLRFSRSLIDRETFRQVKGYSINAFVLMIAGRASVQTGPILVGLLLSAPEVTFFGLAWRLSEFAKALPRSATNTLTTTFSQLDAHAKKHESQRLFLTASRLALWVMLPIQFGLIFHGQSFLTTWLGSEVYAEKSYPSLVILSSILSLLIAQSIAARVLYGAGQLRWFARLAITESVVNLCLGILLARSFGIEGIAWGMVIPNTLMNLWVVVTGSQLLGVSFSQYLRVVVLPALVGGAILCGVWFGIGSSATGWLNLAVSGLIGVVPFALFVLAWERSLRPKSTFEHKAQGPILSV